MTSRLAAVLLALTLSGPAVAQDWSFLGPLTQQTLDVRPGDGAPMLFSDDPDPSRAQTALIFHYFGNRDGGNAVHLNIGLYRQTADGWSYAGPVQELFGFDPREVRFEPGAIAVTTTMQGPDDPRCCPTKVTHWRVDPATRQVTRLD